MCKNEDFFEEVFLPIEDSIDLHTFHPRDIPAVVKEYITESLRLGYREVRIIHGRGKGYQRAVVQSILEKHPYVLSFKDASSERGGWGATLVIIKHDG